MKTVPTPKFLPGEIVGVKVADGVILTTVVSCHFNELREKYTYVLNDFHGNRAEEDQLFSQVDLC